MLPQISLHSTSNPQPTPLVAVTTPEGQSAQPVGNGIALTQAKAGNFAAVFAADSTKSAEGLTTDQPQLNSDAPDADAETGNADAKNQPPKNTEYSRDVEALPGKNPSLKETLPVPKTAEQSEDPLAPQLDNTQAPKQVPVESKVPAASSLTEIDAWHLAGLPKGKSAPEISEVLEPKMGTPRKATPLPADAPTTQITKAPTAHLAIPLTDSTNALPSASSQHAPPEATFKSRLVAEFARPSPQQDSKLVARTADSAPSTPLEKTILARPMPTKSGVTLSEGPTAATKPNPAQTAPQQTGQALLPGPPALVTGEQAPLAKAPSSGNPITASGTPVTRTQASLPTNDAGPTQPQNATPLVKATPLLSGSAQLGGSAPIAHSGTQTTTVVVTAQAPLFDKETKGADRLGPTRAQTTQPPIVTGQHIAPVIPWQPAVTAVDEPSGAKDLFAIDPISGEPRLPSTTIQSPSATLPSRADLPGYVARQLAEAFQQTPNRPIEITLRPQELGAVRMSVQQADLGIIVSLTAERPETLDLMRRHIDQLGQEFQAMGYANIAFSFADGDAGTDPQSDNDDTTSAAVLDDPSEAATTHIHLTAGVPTSGVDIRL